MTISLQFHGGADEVIADMKRIIPALIAGTGLPPMQEQPNRTIVTNTERAGEKPGSRARTKKGESEQGEPADTKTAASQETKTETSGSSAEDAGTKSSAEIPTIDDLRAALKKLGATDGFGHDAVFELLGKYGKEVKSASTLPEDKRAEVIAAIEAMLKAGPAK